MTPAPATPMTGRSWLPCERQQHDHARQHARPARRAAAARAGPSRRVGGTRPRRTRRPPAAPAGSRRPRAGRRRDRPRSSAGWPESTRPAGRSSTARPATPQPPPAGNGRDPSACRTKSSQGTVPSFAAPAASRCRERLTAAKMGLSPLGRLLLRHRRGENRGGALAHDPRIDRPAFEQALADFLAGDEHAASRPCGCPSDRPGRSTRRRRRSRPAAGWIFRSPPRLLKISWASKSPQIGVPSWYGASACLRPMMMSVKPKFWR